MNIYKNQYDRERVPFPRRLNGLSHCVRRVPNHQDSSAAAGEYSEETRKEILRLETVRSLVAEQQANPANQIRVNLDMDFEVGVGLDKIGDLSNFPW